LDGQPSEFFFFSGFHKLEQRAKKCIELRGEYVEYIPRVFAVACFLPGRVKDLQPPPTILNERYQSLLGIVFFTHNLFIDGLLGDGLV
jgi:hypothetical protein